MKVHLPGLLTLAVLAGSGCASSVPAAALVLPVLDSSVASNIAGTLEYCVKNNYLSADAVSGVKDRLLEKVPGQGGFDKGEGGLLTGSDGKTFDLKGATSDVRRKACQQVLGAAGSLI